MKYRLSINAPSALGASSVATTPAASPVVLRGAVAAAATNDATFGASGAAAGGRFAANSPCTAGSASAVRSWPPSAVRSGFDPRPSTAEISRPAACSRRNKGRVSDAMTIRLTVSVSSAFPRAADVAGSSPCSRACICGFECEYSSERPSRCPYSWA